MAKNLLKVCTLQNWFHISLKGGRRKEDKKFNDEQQLHVTGHSELLESMLTKDHNFPVNSPLNTQMQLF